jgi:hypothetical protein
MIVIVIVIVIMVVLVLVVFRHVDQPTVSVLCVVLAGSGSGAACDLRAALLRRATDETCRFLVRNGGRVRVEPSEKSAPNPSHRDRTQYNETRLIGEDALTPAGL